jgi:succinate dehydrogenase cytochrome b subunit
LLLLRTNAVVPSGAAPSPGPRHAPADFHHATSVVRNVKERPVYLDLPHIRLPLPGIVSILHRVSGALLFLVGIPLLLYGVSASLASPESNAALTAGFAHPVAKLVLVGLLWAYIHHFCAGIRFLLLDIHRGIELEPARRSSAVVLVLSLALTLIVGMRLW